MSDNKDFNNLLPEYRGRNLIKSLYKNPEVSNVDRDKNELLETIFLPDPVTGLPRSDLGLIMSKDTSPEVAAYIQENLMHARPSSGTDDAYEALSTVKTQKMSLREYKENIINFIKSKQNENK